MQVIKSIYEIIKIQRDLLVLRLINSNHSQCFRLLKYHKMLNYHKTYLDYDNSTFCDISVI